MWELHRLSRETVLEWLLKRREADGIVSSTQKRRPEKRRGGSSALFIEDGEFERDERGGGRSANGEDARSDREGLGPGPGSSSSADRAGRKGSRGAGESNILMSFMSDVLPREGGTAQQKEAQVIPSNTVTDIFILPH